MRVMTLMVLVLLCAFPASADDAFKLKPIVNMPIGSCDYVYCANTYCHKTEISTVCTDEEDGTLYWNSCTNVAEYYRAGSSCCKQTSVCCTYIDSRGRRRNRADDIGSMTLSCPSQ